MAKDKKNKKAKTLDYKGYTCRILNKWVAPEECGAPIITMPNVPKPLHGPGHQPRTILGKTTWDHMRNRCYFEAGYKCEACGTKVKTEFYDNGAVKHQYHDDGEIPKRCLHAHELYSYDYDKGTARFERCVALCEKCHVRFIHSGRMMTMYEKGDPLMPAEAVLEGIEHGFKQIKEWNDAHYGEEKLRACSVLIDFTEDPTIGEQVKELIEKYDIEFYIVDGEAKWSDWKLIIGDKEYPTKYADMAEWAEAMAKNNAEQLEKRNTWAAKTKKFDGLDSVSITEEDIRRISDAEVPEGF